MEGVGESMIVYMQIARGLWHRWSPLSMIQRHSENHPLCSIWPTVAVCQLLCAQSI